MIRYIALRSLISRLEKCMPDAEIVYKDGVFKLKTYPINVTERNLVLTEVEELFRKEYEQ